jgi:hypothetical protein
MSKTATSQPPTLSKEQQMPASSSAPTTITAWRSALHAIIRWICTAYQAPLQNTASSLSVRELDRFRCAVLLIDLSYLLTTILCWLAGRSGRVGMIKLATILEQEKLLNRSLHEAKQALHEQNGALEAANAQLAALTTTDMLTKRSKYAWSRNMNVLVARLYQAAWSPKEALAELERCVGTQFAPALVPVFRAVLAERTAESSWPDATTLLTKETETFPADKETPGAHEAA